MIQVKTGYSPTKDQVYLTQCAGEKDLKENKFVADFVVFVNLDRKVGNTHQHDGSLGFEHLTFYVVPRDVANQVYRDAVHREYDRPLIKSGERRKLGNMAVNIPSSEFEKYREVWGLINGAPTAGSNLS